MRKNIFRAAFAVLRRGYRSEARTSLSLEKIKKESDMKKKIFFFLGILIIGLITFGPASRAFAQDLIATMVRQTIDAMITPTPTVSIKDIKIGVFVNQTVEAYYIGTPTATPFPKPGNVETAVYGTLEAMKPTETYTDEEREIVTAVQGTVQVLLPTGTIVPTADAAAPLRLTLAAYEAAARGTAFANEAEPLLRTIEAYRAEMTATASALNDPAAIAQTMMSRTVSALQATVSAPRPTVYPTQPPPPPAYYYPATVTAIAPPPPSVPCNQFSFVRDLSIPDGSYMKPNERFTKIWQVQNTGSCTWNPGYYLALFKGTQMGADRVNVDRSVPPGGVIDLSIKLTAPPSEGSYRGHFTMYTPTGIRFMTSSGSQDGIWVDIRVQGSGPAPSPTPAVPASPTPPPAPETWTVHIRHDLNGGHWGAVNIDPHTITAPINQSMPADGLEPERNIEPLKENATFKGWSVRFTNAENGDVVHDGGEEIWDLDHPFDYYPGNPREMDCLMTARWEAAAPETWTVHIRHDLNGGHWGAVNIDPHTITAPINQSMPADGLEPERNIEPLKENATFKGWSVRFTNAENGDVVHDGGEEIWDLDHPFDYYPGNPREMDCLMTARWEAAAPETWSVNIYHDLNGGYWEGGGIPNRTITAGIGQNMPHGALEPERITKPKRFPASFRGWTVRFSDAETGDVIYASGEVWDLNQPFGYYPNNPLEMDCLMTAQWSW